MANARPGPRDQPISAAELAKHCVDKSAWISIDGNVYDISKFMATHPGGPTVLKRYLGKDATQAFRSAHAEVDYRSKLARVYKGKLG